MPGVYERGRCVAGACLLSSRMGVRRCHNQPARASRVALLEAVMPKWRGLIVLIVACLLSASLVARQRGAAPQAAGSDRLDVLKQQAAAEIDGLATFTQQTTDLLFSFA